MRDEIRGRWAVLRPVNDGDIAFVCRMFRDLDSRYLWLEDRRLLPESQLRGRLMEDLSRYYHTFFVFAPVEAPGEPMGIFYTCRYSPANGTTFATIAADPACRKLGCAAEAGVLAYRYLFDNYPLRKVYADIFEYNQESLRFSLDCGFVEEGFMREHVYRMGRYWGMYTLALYRDAFESKSARLLENGI